MEMQDMTTECKHTFITTIHGKKHEISVCNHCKIGFFDGIYSKHITEMLNV